LPQAPTWHPSWLWNGALPFLLGEVCIMGITITDQDFCLINDIIVTIKKLQNEGLIQGAWVIET
jgi:hypothetical protein